MRFIKFPRSYHSKKVPCAGCKDPFSHFDFDGVLGLGLQTLALSHSDHVDPRDEMGRETDELISVQNLFSTVNNFSRVC